MHWIKIILLYIVLNFAECQEAEVSLPIKLDSRFYIFNTNRLVVNKAQQACQSWGAELTSVNSKEEQELIKNYSTKAFAEYLRNMYISYDDRYYWLGGSDLKSEGEWYWRYSGQMFNYSNWQDEEPNNSGHGEHFVAMLASSGEWIDLSASRTARSICKVEDFEKRRENLTLVKFSDEYYYFSHTSPYVSWSEAQVFCESYGMKLAKINNKNVNNFIYNQIKNNTSDFEDQVDYWVGGPEDNNAWTWIDGEELSYTAWFTNRPKKSKLNNVPHCLEVRGNILPHQNWFDEICTNKQRFICSFTSQDEKPSHQESVQECNHQRYGYASIEFTLLEILLVILIIFAIKSCNYYCVMVNLN